MITTLILAILALPSLSLVIFIIFCIMSGKSKIQFPSKDNDYTFKMCLGIYDEKEKD